MTKEVYISYVETDFQTFYKVCLIEVVFDDDDYIKNELTKERVLTFQWDGRKFYSIMKCRRRFSSPFFAEPGWFFSQDNTTVFQ